jgi:hypothetical protein
MSLLALGAEKLLKLTIGLAHLDRDEPWPSLQQMQRIGHRIVSADAQARSMLDLNRGTAPGHLADRLEGIESDPILAVALPVLERFADKGRFYFLDSLGERPQTETAPHFMWVRLVSRLANEDPELSAKMDTPEGWKEGRPVVNQMIVVCLRDWWEFYRAVWMTGANGPLARELSAAVRLLSH